MPKLKINFHARVGPLKKFELPDFDFKECLKVAARMKLLKKKAWTRSSITTLNTC
jgi:hypothetical protein